MKSKEEKIRESFKT